MRHLLATSGREPGRHPQHASAEVTVAGEAAGDREPAAARAAGGSGSPLSFAVVPGASVRRIIAAARPAVFETVRQAYLLHHRGGTVNPPSQTLRFPDRPAARIMALPAAVGGERGVAGVKWIASFPDNVAHDLPRASAVLLLNDAETGYPFACIEASQISAARTAASAVLGGEQLAPNGGGGTVAFVGCGVIARNILDFMVARSWPFEEIRAFDQAAPYSAAFARYGRAAGLPVRAVPALAEALDGAHVVVLATTAAHPYIHDRRAFSPRQVVLNISLRDIGPAIVAEAHNIVDDVDHCLTADTSVHLTQQALGTRAFIDGTLAGLMAGEVRLGPDRPRIFSPFGLGVLDVAVGLLVYQAAAAQGGTQEIAGFFAETSRWGEHDKEERP